MAESSRYADQAASTQMEALKVKRRCVLSLSMRAWPHLACAGRQRCSPNARDGGSERSNDARGKTALPPTNMPSSSIVLCICPQGKSEETMLQKMLAAAHARVRSLTQYKQQMMVRWPRWSRILH